MFYIVSFESGGTEFVEVIPKSWFEDGKVVWPTCKNVHNLVKSGKAPGKNVKEYSGRIIHAYGTISIFLLIV